MVRYQGFSAIVFWKWGGRQKAQGHLHTGVEMANPQ
jgi:hypothetical protein